MKTTVLSNNKYKGVRSYNGKPNTLTKVFYKAKFFKEKKAIEILLKLIIKELTKLIVKENFFCITAVNTVLSQWNLPQFLAKEISKKFKLPYYELFENSNQKIAVDNNKLKGKKILVIDDVIYSGSTMRRVNYLLDNAKADKMFFYALLKSPSYKKK